MPPRLSKTSNYSHVFFPSDVLVKAIEAFGDVRHGVGHCRFTLRRGEDILSYSDLDEFLEEYSSKRFDSFSIGAEDGPLVADLYVEGDRTHCSVRLTNAMESEFASVVQVFDLARTDASLTPENVLAESATEPVVESALHSVRVFIGHGQSPAWRDLKDFLQDVNGRTIEAFEKKNRVGFTVTQVLEELMRDTDLAILVLTAEDSQPDGTIRARQNVVHEAGLFHGRLGFERVALLVEEGVAMFSNVDGVQQIRFPAGCIRETFGDVLSWITREVDASGQI